MQVEIYNLTANEKQISIDLVAICDSFSSLLWDVEFYQCGSFEVYIAANPQNVEVFQLGRIVCRDDDKEHFGIIESVKIETNAEDGDYLTVSGRFLTCLLERRIIYPSFSANNTYENIVRNVLSQNVISAGIRSIPGLSMGTVSGDCWQGKTRLQVSYDNLMEWLYTICETIGGSANIRIDKRTEFQRLIKDCKRGKIDRIYTKSLSRFARNTKECLNTVRLLRELGITLFFEKENIDTAKNTDELMITIMGGLAQEESTSISQNMRWSVKKRMENGTFVQSVPPYGYIAKDTIHFG